MVELLLAPAPAGLCVPHGGGGRGSSASSFSPPTLVHEGGRNKRRRWKEEELRGPCCRSERQPNQTHRDKEEEEEESPLFPTATHCAIALQWTIGHMGRRKEEKRTDLLTLKHPSPNWPPSVTKSEEREQKGMITTSLITETIQWEELRGQTTQNSTLTISFLFTIPLSGSSAACLKKAEFYFSRPETDPSGFPHPTAAAACMYLRAFVRRIHNLSIYVCVSVCVKRIRSAGCPPFERFPVPCAHTHTPPPTTNYKAH